MANAADSDGAKGYMINVRVYYSEGSIITQKTQYLDGGHSETVRPPLQGEGARRIHLEVAVDTSVATTVF